MDVRRLHGASSIPVFPQNLRVDPAPRGTRRRPEAGNVPFDGTGPVTGHKLAEIEAGRHRRPLRRGWRGTLGGGRVRLRRQHAPG
jgi:hypothetical protein